MDELASGVDGTQAIGQRADMRDVAVGLDGRLAPGDAVADRPRIGPGSDERWSREPGQGAMESIADSR